MNTRSTRRPGALDMSPTKNRNRSSPSRSPGRPKSKTTRSPARSPARKSPASPSNPKSKFPARKSPSRTAKETNDSAKQKSPGVRRSIKEAISKTDYVSTSILTPRATRTRRTEYSVKDVTGDLSQLEVNIGDRINGLDSYVLRQRKTMDDFIPRRSGRLQEFTESESDTKKSSSKSLSKSVSSKVIDLTDTDNSEEELLSKKNRSSISVSRRLVTPLSESIHKLAKASSKWEFGGRVGSALLIILLPLTIFSILTLCAHSCSYEAVFDVKSYTNVVWFSTVAVTLVVTQCILQAVLTCIPILGRKADRIDGSKAVFCFNALFSSVVTVILLFTLDFFKIMNSNIILGEYIPLATILYIIASTLSLVLFIKSHNLDDSKLNPYANTGYVLYDFWMGREIHPYIYKLDFKLWISRVCNINALVLAVLLFKHAIHLSPAALETTNLENYKQILDKVELKPTILVYSLMQIVYICNFILREHQVTATFFWNSEGVGYLQTVASALYPFYFTTITKYLVDNEVSLSNNILITASVLYLLGLIILIRSNNTKYEFRKNPLNPNFFKMDTMPTFQGNKLLVSGLWGTVRHPNYLGDILIHVALALPGLVSWSVAAVPGVLTVLVLLHRALRDHIRCQRRYAAAWQRYCKRVPSAIIPKIL